MDFQNIPGCSKLEKALSTKRLSTANIKPIGELTKKELKLTEQGPAKKYIKNHKDAFFKCDKDVSLVYMKDEKPVTVSLVTKNEQGSYDIDYIDFLQGKILECIYTMYCSLKEIVKKISSDEKISFMAATDFSEKLFRKHIEYAPDDLKYKESSVVSMTRIIGKISDSDQRR